MSELRLFLLSAPYLERSGNPLWIEGRPELQAGRSELHAGRFEWPVDHKALALLAYLGTTGLSYRRQDLAALLWPEADPTAALAALGQTLDALAEVLGPQALAIDAESVALARISGESTALWLDVIHFRRILGKVRSHDHPPDEVCRECIPLLSEAVDLYRDEFMAGFELPDNALYEEWQLSEQDALRQEVTQALDRLVRGHAAHGDYETAIATSRRWLALDPSRDADHSELIARYARPLVLATPFVNRQAEVAEIKHLLLDETSCRLLTLLGPGGVGKTRLALQVAEQVGDEYPDGVYIVSLADAESVTESTDLASVVADLLVTAIAEALGLSFQDAQTPQVQLFDYLRSKNALLVLDGMERFTSGTDLLTGIQSAAPGVAILVTSRKRLGLDGERVWGVGGLGYPARSGISSGDAASGDEAFSDATSADATSAERSAVRLFLESVRRLTASAPLSADERRAAVRICQLVEGMPLGLKMASAWARAMSMAQIADDIERNLASLSSFGDVPPERRALRAVFERSWDLLSEEERRTVACLSVFRGGFDWEAAQQVAGASPFLLAALADKALLRALAPCASGHDTSSQAARPSAAPRYDMHELVRQFVADKLSAMPSVEREARDRHCATYSAYLERRAEQLKGPQQSVAADEIAAEINNVRAAWRWAVGGAREAEIRRAMESFYLFTFKRGWLREGLAAFEAAVAALRGGKGAPDYERRELVGRLLVRQARFAHRLGRYPLARDLVDAGLALYDRLGVEKGEEESDSRSLYQEKAFGLFTKSALLRSVGEIEGARETLEQGLALYRACNDPRGTAMTLKLLGIVYGSLDQAEEAQARLREALDLYQAARDPYGTANTLNDLSIVAVRRGRQMLARRLNQECLAIRRQIGDRWGVGTSLNNLGYLAYLSGEHEEAVEYLSEGVAVQRELGDRYQVANCLNNLGAAAHALGRREQAFANLHEALEMAYQIGALPLALEASAEIGALLAEDDEQGGERATEVLTFVHDHPQTDKWTAERTERSLAQLASRLAPDAWAAAQERGRAETLEAVVGALLSHLPDGGADRAHLPGGA
jgi:predicted ATPase/DNA-binding SARP family transcriptional activator